MANDSDTRPWTTDYRTLKTVRDDRVTRQMNPSDSQDKKIRVAHEGFILTSCHLICRLDLLSVGEFPFFSREL